MYENSKFRGYGSWIKILSWNWYFYCKKVGKFWILLQKYLLKITVICVNNWFFFVFVDDRSENFWVTVAGWKINFRLKFNEIRYFYQKNWHIINYLFIFQLNQITGKKFLKEFRKNIGIQRSILEELLMGYCSFTIPKSQN